MGFGISLLFGSRERLVVVVVEGGGGGGGAGAQFFGGLENLDLSTELLSWF